MGDDLYPSPNEYHSVCSENAVNSSFNIHEEGGLNNESTETIKLKYESYSNFNDLTKSPPTLSSADEETKSVNLFSTDNNFNATVCSKASKGSLIVNYSKQMDIVNSRRKQTFKCPYCPKVFCNSSAIAKHKLTHSDERKYVCDICSKAFKRQDHLNGHKHTHKVNKPHACHFCDRSYSDARSLRRHYENQHQKEYKDKMATRDSGSSVDDNGPAIDVFGFFEDHKSVKCEVCGRGFKNQSALNGHMRLHGGYGPTKNTISGPGEPKININILDNSAENNMESLMPTSLSRGASNIILVTSRPDNGTERPIHSLISLIPSSSNASSNFSNSNISPTTRALNSHCFTNSPKYDQVLSPRSQDVIESHNLPNVSIEDLHLVLPPTSKQNIIRDPCSISSTSEKSSSPIEISTDGISYSQSKQSSFNTELPPNQYSPITPAFPNKNENININLHDQTLFTYPSILDNQQAVNHPFERDRTFESNSADDYLITYDKYPSAFVPSNPHSLNKSWPFYDLPINSQETPEYNNSNPPSYKKISSSNNLQDILMNFDNLSDSNDVILNSVPSTIEEPLWSQYHDDNQNISFSECFGKQVKKEEINITSMNSELSSSPITKEDKANGIALNSHVPETQSVIPHKKNKCRPAPIFIPPQTSAHMSRLRSPRVWNTSESNEQKIPPYTPPPMLSPRRKGPGLFNTVRQSSLRTSVNSANSFCSWSTPFSTKPITVVSNNFCSDSIVSSLGDEQISTVTVQEDSIYKNCHVKYERTIEPEHFIYQDEYIDVKTSSLDDKDGLPTSATPRINIGPEYQAQLSAYYPNKRRKHYNRVYDTLLWNPRHFKETYENISSLNLLMKIASSPAVKSCGLNMEYTFHLLFKYEGDLEKTLQALLEESFVVYDYVYAETSKWTTEEIEKFQERLKEHDRDFMRVSLDLQSYGINKSVKACVEFYYVWKQMNNSKDISSYRLKSRRKLATRNSTPQHEYDNYPSVMDPYSIVQASGELPPYNLRKYMSEKRNLTKQIHYYGSKPSSCNSSREPSPSYSKPTKTISVSTQEITKKPRSSYQCSQCNRTFAKLKTLENHKCNSNHNKLSKNKIQSRNIERTAESTRY